MTQREKKCGVEQRDLLLSERGDLTYGGAWVKTSKVEEACEPVEGRGREATLGVLGEGMIDQVALTS